MAKDKLGNEIKTPVDPIVSAVPAVQSTVPQGDGTNTMLKLVLDEIRAERDKFKKEIEDSRQSLKDEWAKFEARQAELGLSVTSKPKNDEPTNGTIPPITEVLADGLKRINVRVSLPHCGDYIIPVDYSPGSELHIRDLAIQRFNKYCGLISTENTYQVSIIENTLPTGA